MFQWKNKNRVISLIHPKNNDWIGSGCCVQGHRATVVCMYLGQPEQASHPSSNKRLLNSITVFPESGRSWADIDICVCLFTSKCVILYEHACTSTHSIYSMCVYYTRHGHTAHSSFMHRTNMLLLSNRFHCTSHYI